MTTLRSAAWALVVSICLGGFGPSLAAQPAEPPGVVCAWDFQDSLRDETARWRDQLSAWDGSGRVVLPRFVTAEQVPGVQGKAVALGVEPEDAAFLSCCTSPDVRRGPAYTVALRFQLTKLDTWARLVLHWGPGAEHAYHVAVHNGQASLYHGEAGGEEAICEGGTVETGRWYRLVAVADRNDAEPGESVLRVYLDGECVATAPYDGTIRAMGGEGLGIGDAAGAPSEANRCRGYVDEVRIWSRALTPNEVAALAAEPPSKPKSTEDK
jgi:hypothetical protein